jgi:glutamate/aspartate transport system substrate-binding protein
VEAGQDRHHDRDGPEAQGQDGEQPALGELALEDGKEASHRLPSTSPVRAMKISSRVSVVTSGSSASPSRDAVKQELKLSSLNVETSPVTSSNRIPLMMNGTVDLVCSATTNNAERQRQVAFTNSHFLSATRFAARKADNITTIDALKGKPVVAISGSTNMVQLTQTSAARNLGVAVLAAKDQAEAFLMLETGRAAAYVLDDVQLAVAIARSKDPSGYIISEETFSKAEPYGIMLRKDGTPFKTVVDRATANLYRSPEIEVIYKKWFESPVPPNGLNFRTPMSVVLRNAFANPSDSADPASYER